MTAPASSISLGPMPSAARMRTVDERVVAAPPAEMFRLAADVERWPVHLPHYRHVRFRTRDGDGGVVEMSANRPFGPLDWPTWWVSLMEVRPDVPVVRFRHIEGITTRMEVEWSFTPVTNTGGGGTHVTVLHLWDGPSWPLLGTFAARAVIGPVFVHGIASRTLEGLARVAERSQSSR